MINTSFGDLNIVFVSDNDMEQRLIMLGSILILQLFLIYIAAQ